MNSPPFLRASSLLMWMETVPTLEQEPVLSTVVYTDYVLTAYLKSLTLYMVRFCLFLFKILTTT